MSNYMELRKIDVSDKIEKKNGLSYLSWAWAVDTLLQHDPTATWSYGQPVMFGETVMVFCTVNAFGKSMTAQLPVMDYRNKAIPNPDAFAVNTAMQRCLAKAIALHGLGGSSPKIIYIIISGLQYLTRVQYVPKGNYYWVMLTFNNNLLYKSYSVV